MVTKINILLFFTISTNLSAKASEISQLEKLPKGALTEITQLEKLPKDSCEDSESTFKRKNCDKVKKRKKLCTKEWIAHLCPTSCNVPPSSNCCVDYEGEFPLKSKDRTCEFLIQHQKVCERKAWVKDLCPETCGICPQSVVEVDEMLEDEDYIGIVKDNKFITSPNQPLKAEVELFGHSSIEAYESCDEFKSDLTNAATMIVNDVISDNALYDIRYHSRGRMPMPMAEEAQFGSARGEESYETNVQVEGVDEADIIKSTNETVYAAYGDKLIVWEAKSLKMLSITIIPPEKEEKRKLSSEHFPFQRQVLIRGLLLYENRLLVIVSYDQWYYPFWYDSSHRSILQNYGAIGLRLYDVSNLPDDGLSELNLIATKKLSGNYIDARLIESTAHVVTSAQIDTYYHLTRHFSRYTHQELYLNMSKVEYIDYATSYAKSAVIPSFVQKFLEEIDVGDKCQNILKLTLFQSFNGAQPQKVYQTPRMSILNGLAQVTTFDMDGNFDEGIIASLISIPLPSTYSTKVYASVDKLVLATRGYEVNKNGTGWTDRTFFQVLTLDKNEAESHSFGEVTGYLINQYAMDIWDDHLRVATTKSAKWGCVDANNTATNNTGSDVTFRRSCDWQIIVDSDNFVHVLRIPMANASDELEQVGFLNNLGKEGERIEAVRFMREKAFVVTFLRTDPFYTLDLSDHENPKEVGALEITGYSNYLHPYDREGNILIGVGQDADELGRATGLQISLFNTTELGNATLIKRYSVENEIGFNESNVWSFSEAQYDPKAFRFLPISKKLILPTSIRDYKNYTKNFDGFLVFDLSLDNIAYSFNISHVDPDQVLSFCWYNAYLSSRSLVHDGILTTSKGHTILIHNLDTKEMLHSLNLDENNTECGRWGYWVF